jgi:hypothetical protein
MRERVKSRDVGALSGLVFGVLWLGSQIWLSRIGIGPFGQRQDLGRTFDTKLTALYGITLLAAAATIFLLFFVADVRTRVVEAYGHGRTAGIALISGTACVALLMLSVGALFSGVSATNLDASTLETLVTLADVSFRFGVMAGTPFMLIAGATNRGEEDPPWDPITARHLVWIFLMPIFGVFIAWLFVFWTSGVAVSLHRQKAPVR